MYAEVRYLFCFFVVAKGCFSLSVVEVECIVVIEVTLQKEKHSYAYTKRSSVHMSKQKCIQSVSFLSVVQITEKKEKHTHTE